MILRIVFLDAEGKEIRSTPWDQGVEAAKEHARVYRKIHKARVALVAKDDTGDVLFRDEGFDDEPS